MKKAIVVLLLSGCGSQAGTVNQADSQGGDAGATGKQNLILWPVGDSITRGDLQVGGNYVMGGGYRTALHRLFVAGGYNETFAGTLEDGPSTPDGGVSSLPNQYHDGHSGLESNQEVLPQNMPSWVMNVFYSLPIILIGTNDLNHGYQSDVSGSPGPINSGYYNFDLPSIAGRTLTMVRIAQAGCFDACPVIVATLPPINTKQALVTAYNAQLKSTMANIPGVFIADVNAAMTIDDICSDGLHPTASGYEKIAETIFETFKAIPSSEWK